MAEKKLHSIPVHIYGLIDPITTEIRYVGRTKRSLDVRLRSHIKEARVRGNTHVHCWIKSLSNRGASPEMVLLQECNSDTWSEGERFWIEYFRSIGADLTNIAVGGQGPLGFQHKEETKARWRESRRGEACYWYGKKRDPALFALMNEKKRQKFEEFGHPLKGKVYTEEERFRMGNGRRGKSNTEYMKKRTSETAKELWTNPKWKEWASKMRGESHRSAKLTEDDVRAIRQDIRSCRKIASQYGVDSKTISSVKSGKSWKHVI